MAVPEELFAKGDVYIDYPQEDVMFHFERQSGKVFRKFYWRPAEDEVPYTSSIFAESMTYGTPVTRDQYLTCMGRAPQAMVSQQTA
jgi:hypothetical protein